MGKSCLPSVCEPQNTTPINTNTVLKSRHWVTVFWGTKKNVYLPGLVVRVTNILWTLTNVLGTLKKVTTPYYKGSPLSSLSDLVRWHSTESVSTSFAPWFPECVPEDTCVRGRVRTRSQSKTRISVLRLPWPSILTREGQGRLRTRLVCGTRDMSTSLLQWWHPQTCDLGLHPYRESRGWW